MSPPIRAPGWSSARRQFEQRLSDLQNCRDMYLVKQLQTIIFKSNLHKDTVIATKLISAYSIHRIESATNVFNQIPHPDVQLFNTLIQAHIRNSLYYQAFATFSQMRKTEGISSSVVTYSLLLKACSDRSWIANVRILHSLIEKYGIYYDLIVPNSLIEAYCKCGSVDEAKKQFGSMEVRNVLTCNCMMSGLVKAGDFREALQLFEEIHERDTVSWNIILDGYVKTGEMTVANEFFLKVPSRDCVSWTTMLAGYSRVRDMKMARNLFEEMPVKNLESWTIMITGYTAIGLAKEAMALFDQMVAFGPKLDEGALASILAACADTGMAGLGEKAHVFIDSRYKFSICVCNALINMYAKCGYLDKALSIFNEMSIRDLVSWSTMINGLGVHGYGEMALDLFCKMQQEGLAPNGGTFLSVLSACSHAGLVEEGICYFYKMQNDYGVIPKIEHYGSMIDLLGRGGRLKEAFRLVCDMPFEPNDKIWGALIAACRNHHVDSPLEDLKYLVQWNQIDSGNLSLLSNICAATGDWTSFADARVYIKKTGSKKQSGISCIELDDEFHEFTVLDQSHPKCSMIYGMINMLSQHIKKLCCLHGMMEFSLDMVQIDESGMTTATWQKKKPEPYPNRTNLLSIMSSESFVSPCGWRLVLGV